MASCVMIFAALCVLAISMQPSSAQVLLNRCSAPGLYHNPADCATYYECVSGRSIPVIKRCGPGTLFNHLTLQCDWTRNVNCNRNVQPVILTNQLPAATVLGAVNPHNPVTVSISNPFGRLNINSTACNNIASALYSTLRNQVAFFDGQCGQICLDSLPNFLVICNQ